MFSLYNPQGSFCIEANNLRGKMNLHTIKLFSRGTLMFVILSICLDLQDYLQSPGFIGFSLIYLATLNTHWFYCKRGTGQK